MNKCKYLKKKISGKTVCNLDEKREVPKMCNSCAFKEFETPNCVKYQKNYANYKMKSKSSKLAKLERDRESLFTDDMDHCIICGKKKEHLHEVYSGAYRIRSIKEHMVLPLCSFHHRQIHEDMTLNLYWKRSCQKLFEESHSRDEFITIFGRSYL